MNCSVLNCRIRTLVYLSAILTAAVVVLLLPTFESAFALPHSRLDPARPSRLRDFSNIPLAVESKKRRPFQTRNQSRTRVFLHQIGLATGGFHVGLGSVIVNHGTLIKQIAFNGRHESILVSLEKHRFKTFAGDTVSFQLSQASRPLRILETDVFDGRLYFLIGHKPDRIFEAPRILPDSLYSLDLKTGELKLIDQIPTVDFGISDIQAHGGRLYTTHTFARQLCYYQMNSSTSQTPSVLWSWETSYATPPMALTKGSPISFGFYGNTGVLLLDGSMTVDMPHAPHLVIQIDLNSGDEIQIWKIPLLDPRQIQMATANIALISHANGLAALNLESGEYHQVINGNISYFSYSTKSGRLYYETLDERSLIQMRLKFQESQ